MILVFGSLNVDLVFEVEAIPNSGQTLLARTMRMEPGGKGANQALAARRAGADVAMVGAVGRDALAERALSNLRAEGVDVSGIAIVDAPTGCASICTDASGQNQIVVALGANASARETQVDDALLARASHVLSQGESEAAEIEALIFRAKDAGAQVILNLAPVVTLPERALRNVDLLVVNTDEASALAALVSCEGTAKGLHIALGIDVIRTLGADGAEAATLDGLFHVPADKIKAVDTTGAGDVYVGVLAAALARGEPLALAMRNANKAATQACLWRGTQGAAAR